MGAVSKPNCPLINGTNLQAFLSGLLSNGFILQVQVSCSIMFIFSPGLPGHPAEPKDGMAGPRGPRGFPGPMGIAGMAGNAGVPGFCEARDCSIHAPVMRKEQGLVKGPLSIKT